MNGLLTATKKSSQHSGRNLKEVIDDSKCPDVSDICKDFHEHKRHYKVNDAMPADIKLRGTVLHNRIKKYFESKMVPAVRARRSGSLDAAAVYKAAMKQIDFFSRNEQNKMIILLTDENADCAGRGLNTVIHNIRKSGITLVGIYFENSISNTAKESFDTLFEHRDNICCTPENIGNEFVRIVQKFCKK